MLSPENKGDKTQIPFHQWHHKRLYVSSNLLYTINFIHLKNTSLSDYVPAKYRPQGLMVILITKLIFTLLTAVMPYQPSTGTSLTVGALIVYGYGWVTGQVRTIHLPSNLWPSPYTVWCIALN